MSVSQWEAARVSGVSPDLAVQHFGLNSAKRGYLRKREEALETEGEEAALEWDKKIEDAEKAFKLIRRKCLARNGLISVILSAGVIWILAGADIIVFDTFGSWLPTLSMLWIFFVLSLTWTGMPLMVLASVMFNVAVYSVIYQSYLWLRSGSWPAYSITIFLEWFGIRNLHIDSSDWVGGAQIINVILDWFMARSFGGGVLYLTILMFIIAALAIPLYPPDKDNKSRPWDYLG